MNESAEQPKDPPRRPRRVRRSGAQLASSTLSDSSHGGAVADVEPDEVDDAVAVPDLNSRVRDSAPVARNTALLNGTEAEEYSPSSRMDAVRRRAPEYEREYRLDLLRRLLLAQVPLDEIANQLGVSLSTVQRDRAELGARARQAAKDLDINQIIGESTEFYRSMEALAARAASNANIPIAMRLAGIRTALAARNDSLRAMQATGVLDVLRYRRGAEEGEKSDIETLIGLTRDLIADTGRDKKNPLGEFSGGDKEDMQL